MSAYAHLVTLTYSRGVSVRYDCIHFYPWPSYPQGNTPERTGVVLTAGLDGGEKKKFLLKVHRTPISRSFSSQCSQWANQSSQLVIFFFDW